MFFTGEVKSGADGKSGVYDVELTHVLSVEWPNLTRPKTGANLFVEGG